MTTMALLVLALAATAYGTSSEEKAVVLRVGPLAVTLEDLAAEFRRAAVVDTSTITPDRAGMSRFLERYTDQLVLYAFGMRDTTVLSLQRRISLEESIRQVLKDALREEILPVYAKIDDDLLRRVYARMATELRLSVIRVATYPELDSVKADLAAGVPFADVARKRSRDPDNAPQGGDLGWVQASTYPPETQEILWSLGAGEQSPLIEEPYSHSIYRVMDRRPYPSLRSFEEERANLYRATITPVLGRIGSEIHGDLMSKYNFRVDPEAAEWMRAFLHKETAGVKRGFDPDKDKPIMQVGKDAEGPPWSGSPLSREESLRPIAFVDGDTMNAIELIDQLDFLPTLTWPKFETVDNVTELCDMHLYERVQGLEALRRNLDKRPDVAQKILLRKGRYYWRGYLLTKLLPKIEPTDVELRSLYESRLSQYDLPERRRFVLINVSTLDLAQQAAARLRKGMVPTSIVREIGRPDLNFMVTPDTTAGWSTFGQHPGIDMVLFGLRKGDVPDPVADQGGYSVFRLEDISPAHVQTFEEVAPGLRRGLIAVREKAAIADILREVKPTLEIWTDDAAIATMPIDPAQFQKRIRGPMN